MKKIITVAFILFSAINILKADILFLNNGDEINCKFINMKNGKVNVKINDEEKTFNLKDVMKIQIVKEFKAPNYNPFNNNMIKELLKNRPSDEYLRDSGYLIKLNEVKVNIDKDKNYETEIHKIIYVLTEKGKDYAGNAKIYYFPTFQKPDIDYAFSIFNNKIFYLNDISTQKGDEYSMWPEYNLLKSYKFSVPNVKVGSVIEYRYRIKSKYNKYIPFSMTSYFRYYEPAEKIKIKVIAPKGIKINYSNGNAEIKPLIKKSNNKTVYTWQVGKQPPYISESNTPPYEFYAPHISVALDDSWENIAKTFEKKIEEVYEVNKAIKDKVKELTENKNSDTDKIKSIFYWVASKINLAPVTMDEYSYIPKSPVKIFNSKTGNYLDKTFLLYAMLKEAGYNPEFVYITSKGHLFKPDLPSVKQFSRAELKLKLNKKTYYLAPVDDKQKFAQLLPSYQNIYGLVITGKEKGKIIKNPLLKPEKESILKREKITLDKNGNITVELKIRPKGAQEYSWRDLKDLKEEEIKNQILDYINSIHPSSKLISYEIKNLDNPDKELKIDIKYRIKDYALKIKDKYLLFKLPAVKFSASVVSQEKRELPLYFSTKGEFHRKTELTIPDNFKVYALPEKVNIKYKNNRYKAYYKTKKDKIKFRQKFTRNSILIKPSEYTKYKKFIEKISESTEKWIVLKNKNN